LKWSSKTKFDSQADKSLNNLSRSGLMGSLFKDFLALLNKKASWGYPFLEPYRRGHAARRCLEIYRLDKP
jgi:hypothetical protein